MTHQCSIDAASIWTRQSLPRVAVIGAGFAGLSCARALSQRGCNPVVFEADDRLGGRCSSRSTPIGVFDDGAQCINGAPRLATLAVQRPGELVAMHPWTVPATPAEEARDRKDWKLEVDEANVDRTLNLMGSVGVPSMQTLAEALAEPLDVRLRTPILQARRRGSNWLLRGPAGGFDEDFQALVLALPAPQAMPLLHESAPLTDALRAVRFRSRWVLLLGSERPVPLPGYREFQGSPIERVAAMHSKPGRPGFRPQRWFIEADERWSLQHEHDDAETVADLLLENFCAHAGRKVTPNYLRAHHWPHAFVEKPATTPRHSQCLWDGDVQLGVCGDSVVTSTVGRVHDSGVAMARAVAEGLTSRRRSIVAAPLDRSRSPQLEPQL